MRAYAYFRVDPYSDSNEAKYCFLLKEKGYSIQKNRVVIEEVGVGKSIRYRSKFINLIEYSLEPEDLLIVKGIDCLGSNYAEILGALEKIAQRGIRLICMDFSKNELSGDVRVFFLHFLKLCLDFENLGFDYELKLKDKKMSKKVGRPEKLSNEQQKMVIDKFKKGLSMYRLAQEFQVSRTVIRRILENANKEFK